MPLCLAVAEDTNCHSVFDDIGNDADVRIASLLDPGFALPGWQRILELAEMAGESDKIIVAQRLATKQQHKVFQPSSV